MIHWHIFTSSYSFSVFLFKLMLNRRQVLFHLSEQQKKKFQTICRVVRKEVKLKREKKKFYFPRKNSCRHVLVPLTFPTIFRHCLWLLLMIVMSTWVVYSLLFFLSFTKINNAEWTRTCLLVVGFTFLQVFFIHLGCE